MAKLTKVKGDATAPEKDDGDVAIIAHVCNNIGGWGAGFVVALSKKWPEPEAQYRRLSKIFKDSQAGGMSTPFLGTVQVVPVETGIAVANMIAQCGTTGDKCIRYAALVDCMRTLALKIKDRYTDNDNVQIHCPMFGAGLAGGDWVVIEALIQEIWVDYGINVTVYEFDG